MNPGRRRALRVLAGTGVATAAATAPARAARLPKQVSPDAVGMLYDTTKCIGCKACVVACREANGLTADTSLDGLHQAPLDLNGQTKNVIKLYHEGERVSFFKVQCLHCVDPACASACMLHSLWKDEKTGIVGYNPQYCVGCRYCQMACPFNVPKFEYAKTAPKIVKCELCRHLLAQGKIPACCDVCPRQAVVYGKRAELLAEAKRRIADQPGRYVPHVYGETEAGGTQVLYLSHVPFEKLGLPAYGPEGVPNTAYTIQEGLYQGFVAPVALYAVLGVVLWRNRAGAQDAPPSRPAQAREEVKR